MRELRQAQEQIKYLAGRIQELTKAIHDLELDNASLREQNARLLRPSSGKHREDDHD